MLFRDAKCGNYIYILNRQDMSVDEKKVMDVTVPHLDTNNFTANKMVVDVRVENGATYTMPETSDIAYVADIVIATEKKLLVGEVESIKGQSEKALSEVEYHKNRLTQCEELLSVLNPAIKEKKETDERLNKLETSMGDIKEMLTSLNNKLMTKI